MRQQQIFGAQGTPNSRLGGVTHWWVNRHQRDDAGKISCIVIHTPVHTLLQQQAKILAWNKFNGDVRLSKTI